MSMRMDGGMDVFGWCLLSLHSLSLSLSLSLPASLSIVMEDSEKCGGQLYMKGGGRCRNGRVGSALFARKKQKHNSSSSSSPCSSLFFSHLPHSLDSEGRKHMYVLEALVRRAIIFGFYLYRQF